MKTTALGKFPKSLSRGETDGGSSAQPYCSPSLRSQASSSLLTQALTLRCRSQANGVFEGPNDDNTCTCSAQFGLRLTTGLITHVPKDSAASVGATEKGCKDLRRVTRASAPSPVQTDPKKIRAATRGELGGVLVSEMGQTQKVRGYTAPAPRGPESSQSHREGGESRGRRAQGRGWRGGTHSGRAPLSKGGARW